ASTDENGNFLVPELDENLYKLQISYIGYNSTFKNDVRVVRGKATNVTVELSEALVTADEVVVTANYFEEKKDAPVSNYTYSLEEVKRNPGSGGDIFRAIETLPGVSSGGGEFSAFAVRGGSPKENIILVDNIPFDQVSHLSGGNEEQEAQGGRFSIFAPELIAEAEFQGGGFSSRYGGKSASYVSLKVKEGNKDNFTLSGYYDILGGGIDYTGPTYLHKNTSLILSARHFDFERVLDLTGQKDLGHPSFTDLIFKTTTQINENNKVSVLGIFAPEKYERTPKHVFASDTKAETQLQKLTSEKALLGISWRVLTGKNSFLQNTFYYKLNDVEFSQGKLFLNQTKTETDTIIDKFETIDKQTELGYKADFSYDFQNDSELKLGFEINRQKMKNLYKLAALDTLFLFDKNDLQDTTKKYLLLKPENFNRDFNETNLNFSNYAELSKTFAKKLTVNPGLRYDYNQLTGKSYFSPRFSTTYELTQKTRLSFATGVFYQNPEIKILLASASNKKLKNEKAYHFIFGFTNYLQKDLKFTAEIYYKKFDDLVVRPSRSTAISTNQGDGWGKGIDLSIIKQLVNNVYGQVSYSYAQSKRNDNIADDGQEEYNSDFNQPHVFNFLVGYLVNKNFSVSGRWKYATGRPKDDFIVNENVFNDENNLYYSKEIVSNNTKRLSPYHTLNVRVDYRWQFNHFALVAFLDVLDVYGRLNVSEERFLEKTGKVEKQGFRIIPTGGMKVEF
ncbi:TonB-dependent receptor, partial [bacterium]|nr:TonB-dependent receptor [bacterium]